MSQFRVETLVCPQCNRRDTIRLWEEINVEKDVTARNRLLDGSLFMFRCKSCGYTANVAYNCMYKDSDRGFSIYFAADGEVKDMAENMAKVDAEARSLAIEGMKLTHKRRIVTDGNALREKVIIFESGLDDRVVEMMKYFYFKAVMEDHPDLQIVNIFFCIVDGVQRFEIQCVERVFGINVPDTLYKTFEDEYSGLFDKVPETYIIDGSFAMSVMSLYESENNSENEEK